MQDTRHNNHFLSTELGLKCSLSTNVLKANANLKDSKKLTNLTNHTNAISMCSSTNINSLSHNRSKMNPENSPVLTAILKSNDILPYVLQFNCLEKNIKSNDRQTSHASQFKDVNNLFESKEHPSIEYDDYFEVSPEHTKLIEKQAPDNSLFLAVARSLLYKVYFFDKKYEFVLRNLCLDDGFLRDEFKFDSDLSLQEVLRKKLCKHWLSFVVDGKFKSNDCKYSK